MPDRRDRLLRGRSLGGALAGSLAPTLARSIPVPGMPLGVTITPDGEVPAVVADSNRFGAGGATSDLDVVNVAAALAGRPAVVGSPVPPASPASRRRRSYRPVSRSDTSRS